MAALVCGERDLPVLDLLSRRVEVGAQDTIRFVAMPEEVGETFIRGILGPRSEANLITCPDGSVSAVAAQIIEVAIMQQASVIFLADAITVSNVSKHLTKHYFEPDAMKGRSANDVDFICRLVRGARIVHSAELPVNELAIALPRDERDWRSLLREVQREELFGAEAALTARLYAEIIAMVPQLEPLPLTPELSPSKAKRFAQLFAKAATLQLKQELLDKSGPSDRSSRSSRLSAFIERWTGDATPNPSPVWGGFQSNIFKPALEYIESAILGFHSDYVQGLTITPAIASKTLHFLNVSETICQYAILPALANCGLLEAQTKDTSECLSPLSKFPNSYLVPNVPADSKRGRWMFWQRYHSEVVFACLIASMPTDKKREAIEFIRNHMVSVKALQGPDTFDGVASRVKQDREFHLSICYCGSPEDRPDAALRTLERAFNRLNAALSQSAASRFAKINTQHEEILSAIESSGDMPVQENYSKIFAAYESHFFDLRHSYLSLDSDFQSRLSNSVLREVSSLEKIEAHRFFEGLRCQVYRSQSNAPLEWSAIEQDAVLCNNIVDAIIAGATFHYVSDKETVLPRRDFEAFLSKINSTLSRRGHDTDLSKRIFRVVIPEPSSQSNFFKNSFEKECNALLIYGDRDCVSSWQLTVRRGLGSVAPQEIRRRIDASDAQKRDYLLEYCHSLSALSEFDCNQAIESIKPYI